MEFSIIFLTFSFTWILSQSSDDITEVQSTNACENSGNQLVCGYGRIIQIHDVLCLPSNYTCPEKQRILDICDGQNSCSTLGLKNQIRSYCRFSFRNVLITYSCVRDVQPPPCRTNLCSDESQGIFCTSGSIIHIRKALCVNPNTECTWKIIHTLYILCEGKTSCFASGLRLFMPNVTCLNALPRNANLFVDYICVPEKLSNDLCTGQMLTLQNNFGLIKSPGFPSNPYGNLNGCFWAVIPGRSQFVQILIHVLFSRDSVRLCDEKYLQITYTDCRTLNVKNEHYCAATNPNMVRKSCGALYVRHSKYLPGDKYGNRFVISYEVREYRSLHPSYPQYMTQCSSTQPLYNTSARSYTTRGDNKYLAKDGTYNNTDEVMISTFDPDRFYAIFKIVVINFFLFVIAFWLVFAICLVCCRYCKLNKTGQYKLATQSDTDSAHSGRRTDPGGTSMQTFSEGIEESPDSETCFNHIEKRNTKLYSSVSSDGPYASVDKSVYYPDSRFDLAGNTGGNSNRISSFRPPKVKNPYASYDSLDFDEPEELPEYNPNLSTCMQTSTISKTTEDEFPPPPPPELLGRPDPPSPSQPLKPQGYEPQNREQNSYQNGAIERDTEIKHYTINDDDYAIVQKPKRKPQIAPRPKQAHNPMYGHIPRSASNNQRPGIPNEIHSDEIPTQGVKGHSPTGQPTGYLPQHNCMLECEGNHPHNFPPPAQMNRQRANGNMYTTNTPYSHERTEHF